MSRDDRYDDGRHDDDRGHDLDDALKIRTRGSRVVKVKEWDHGRWKREDLDRNERYVLKDDLLVYKRGNRVRIYEDADGDGIWRRTVQSDPVISGGVAVSDSRADSLGYGEDAYRFDLVNGQVVNLQELDDGRWQSERIDVNETWTFDGVNLIKTEREGSGSEISTYADPNADGVFTKISEVYASSGLA